MRQASWEDLFRQGEVEPAPKPSVWSKLAAFVSWEELLTLLIVLIGFLTVVQSIDSANWVPEMPSLYPAAFAGLGIGLLLSRTRLAELFAHLTALALGCGVVLYSSTSELTGSFSDRVSELADRINLWGDALINGGISNDNLPFVLLVVALTYVAAYISAWSLFRWYNAWLGLIPGGLALLTNLSYLPGHKSLSLVIYLFCSILLVSRVNLLRHAREWRRQRTAYPDLISLHVLNVTIWVAVALLLLAWIAPIGSGSGALYTLWQKATSPLSGPLDSFARVFSAVDAKKGGSIHSFGSTLPLQGAINLSGNEVMRVTATEPGFLRAQSYDFYTAQGWKISNNSQITSTAWPALKAMQSIDDARRQLRRSVSVEVTTSKKAGVLVSDSEPLAVSIDSRVVFGPDPTDITSLRPQNRLNEGAQYRVDSTISNASVGRLRVAGTAYPSWIGPYLQLPSDLPPTIYRKALEVTAGATDSYDKADLIEQYLRTLAVDTKIKPAPANKDSVAYFLFDVGRGYFDYHASAMVVMLRSLGIPARLAVGYVIRPQDRIPDSNVYVVAEANAFAWPEIYFPALGWVEFNPTPSEPRIARSGTDDQSFGSSDDTANEDEDDLLGGSAGPTEPAADQVDALQVKEGSHLVSRIIFSIVLLFLGVTVAGVSAFQYSWQHGLGGMTYPVQVWEKTLRLGRWSRIRPTPQETPREVIARLKRQLPEVDDLDYLGESFIRARYGQKELAPEEKQRLTAVWNQVRNTLMARLFRWK